MDPYNYVCGYVNIQNGLVYPCDPGCCGGKCNQTVSGVRFKIDPSQYADNLPAGYNINLEKSDTATPGPGTPIPETKPSVSTPVWKVMIIPIIVLVFILLLFFMA
jgi:hypothetical protein